MLSKLMLLIGLLVGFFIASMCVDKNKNKLLQKYKNNTSTPEIQVAKLEVPKKLEVAEPEIPKEPEVSKKVEIPKEPIKEEKPPVILELDSPTFIYDIKDKMLTAKLSSKDKTTELEEFILSYCPQDSCTQDLSFEDTTKVATWKTDALKVVKFLKDEDIKDGMLSIDDKGVTIKGEFKNQKQNEALDQLLKATNWDNLEFKNDTTIVEAIPEKLKPVEISVEQTQHEIDQLLASNPIYFKFNSSQLTQNSKNTLDQVISLLSYIGDIPITVEGHTDASGRASYNKKLSQRRADAVKQYLKNQNLINSIQAIGYGEERPISLNPKDQINRRVEINIKQGV